jgi:hypothetical protein
MDMNVDDSSRRLWLSVRREEGAQYLLVAIVSYAVSVALVRGFLNLTGFPQIGGGAYHISHVLWGGLLLFVAAVALLTIDTPVVYIGASILSGAGFGLFIDEVGKFITSDYNYFFLAAAPIVYIIFLVTLLVYLRLRRPLPHDTLNELDQSLELLEKDILQPLGAAEWAELDAHLASVAGDDPAERTTRLGRVLLDYVRSESHSEFARRGLTGWQRAIERLNRWLKEDRLRGLLVAGLVLLALIILKDPVSTATWMPHGLSQFLQGLRFGPEVSPLSAPGLSTLRMVLEVAIGALSLAAAGLLAFKRVNAGVALGYLSLLAALLTLDILVFYFEQFSAILGVAYQFLLLLGLLAYRRRFPVSLDRAPRYARAFISRIERSFTLRPRRPRRRLLR